MVNEAAAAPDKSVLSTDVESRTLLDAKLGSEQTLVADLEEGETVLFEYNFDVDVLPGGLYRFTGDEPTSEEDGTTSTFAHEKVDAQAQIYPVILEFEVEETDEYVLYVVGANDAPGDGGHVKVSVLS